MSQLEGHAGQAMVSKGDEPVSHDLQFLSTAFCRRPGEPQRALERRDAFLLVCLALQGELSRSQMAAWLWPEAPATQAMANLRQRLFRLRKNFGLDVTGVGDVLRLPPGVSHDLQSLDDASLQTLVPGPRPQLLAGHRYDDCELLAQRVDAARAEWSLRCELNDAARAEALEKQGRLAEALLWAQHLTLNHPGSEHAHRRVMRLHYRRGDRTAALEAALHCRESLWRELATEPGPETLALQALIERSETLPSLLPSSAVVEVPGEAGTRDAFQGPDAALMAALRRPPVLVGRELAWQAVDAARQQGRFALISGEAGIGKSRLAEDYSRALGPALWLKAYAGDAATPYALLSRWLHGADMAPYLSRLTLPATNTLASLRTGYEQAHQAPLQALNLLHAVTELLVALQQAGTACLVMDDLQWADSATLECLLGSVNAAGDNDSDRDPLPWVMFTWRTDPAGPPFAAWWAQQMAERVQEVRLEPLSLACVQRFLSTLGLPQLDAADAILPPEAESGLRRLSLRLSRDTGGRPLFMLERLRASGGRWADLIHGSLPAIGSVLQMVEWRLSQLSIPALRLLRVAAFLGSRYSLPVAARVLQEHPVDLIDPLVQLQAAHLMDDHGVAFDLAQEATLRAVPLPVAKMLHHLIAEALTAEPDVAAAEVAAHWELAEQWTAAALAFERAAQQAWAASRRAEELAFWDRAEAALLRSNQGQGETSPVGLAAQRFSWRVRAAQAAIVCEAPDRIDARLTELQAMAQGPEQALQAALVQGRSALIKNQGQVLRDVASRALSLAQSQQDVAAELTARAWMGLGLAMTGAVEEGLGWLERSKALADGLMPLQAAHIDHGGALGFALQRAERHVDALACFQRASALAQDLGHLSEAVDHRASAVYCLQMLGRAQEAAQAMEQMRAQWRQMGQPGGTSIASMMVYIAMNDYAAGRVAAALDLLHWCLGQFRQGHSGVWQVIVENRLATLYLRLGQWARARQVMTTLPPDLHPEHALVRARLHLQLDAVQGQSIVSRLQDLLTALSAQVSPMGRFGLMLHIAAEAAPAQALTLCDQILAQVAPDQRPLRLHVAVRQADALRRLGQHEQGAQLVMAQMPVTCQPLDLDPAAFWAMAIEALREGQQIAAAQILAAQAQEWLQQTLAHLPPAFKPSLLDRNAHVRRLRESASQMAEKSPQNQSAQAFGG